MQPESIRRSVWIATPLIAGAFILGTACVLVFVKPEDIDLISPITQVLNRGMQSAGLSGSATSLVGTLIVLTLIGQAAPQLQLQRAPAAGSGLGSSASRLVHPPAS